MTPEELLAVLARSDVSELEARLLLRAGTAAGNGSLEERLIRLMVYVGAVLESGESHSKIYDPIEILESGEGWCDQQVIVFLYLAWKLLGLTGRDISIYHTDGKNGYTVCEVLYEGCWHLLVFGGFSHVPPFRVL